MTTGSRISIQGSGQKAYTALRASYEATSTRWALLDKHVAIITHTYCNKALAHTIQRAFRALPLVCAAALLPFPLTLGSYYSCSLLLLADPECFSGPFLSYVHDGGGFYSMSQVVRCVYVFVKTISPLYLGKGIVWSVATFCLFRSPPRDPPPDPACCQMMAALHG